MINEVKDRIKDILIQAVRKAEERGILSIKEKPDIRLEIPRNTEHGDIATNFCFLAAKKTDLKPREIAAVLAELIQADSCSGSFLERVESAGGGFLNFTFNPAVYHSILRGILDGKDSYGSSRTGNGERVLIEYVSANPTGPLHIGHARNAAVGDCLANILEFSGYTVSKEYYLNDTGRQINMLSDSLRKRHMQAAGQKTDEKIEYNGGYLKDIAMEILEKDGMEYRKKNDDFYSRYAVSRLSEMIRSDLDDFGVSFDGWFSEKNLHESGMIEKSILMLEEKNAVEKKDGALWFKASDFGDEKERVIIKSDGSPTYLAADIAYHYKKLQSGYDILINVWGADHHGYIPRIRGVVEAMGFPPQKLHVVLIQLVKLCRGKKPVPMSTRAGEFLTMRDVVAETGRDALRFFMLMRRSDAQLEFDIELAKKQSMDNPVYYVQYAYARICSILSFSGETGGEENSPAGPDFSLLNEKEEIALMKTMGYFPDVVEGSCSALEPHRLTGYLQELAARFHNFYDKHRVVGEDKNRTAARLALVKASKTVLENGLRLLGVSRPEQM